MENLDRLTVGGYIFASPEDADAAENEIKKIAYIESKADLTNVAVIKQVYEKALDSRTFTTPIGLEYMHNLWTILKDSGIPESEIRPIPLYSTFHRMAFNNDQPVKRRMTKAQKKEQSLKLKYRNAVLIAMIFAILAIAMFVITLNGSTPNAINYKKAITNQYSAWEQDLTERERVIREKERELNINN